MSMDPIDKLMGIGFSEYEAKTYVGLLKKSPVTGYELSKLSSVPRSMIYEVVGKLVSRGAAMSLRTGGAVKYAPVPADEFLDQFRREQNELTDALRNDLASFSSAPDLDYVWNIAGQENIIGRAIEMIDQSKDRVCLALTPTTFPSLQRALTRAAERGVRVVIYTTSQLQFTAGRVVVTHVAEETLGQARGLGLILVVDREEVLIGEWLPASHAHASWTSNPLLVFIAEHHLRTDLYLPELLALLGDRALDIIHEEDRDLFARAMESRIDA